MDCFLCTICSAPIHNQNNLCCSEKCYRAASLLYCAPLLLTTPQQQSLYPYPDLCSNPAIKTPHECGDEWMQFLQDQYNSIHHLRSLDHQGAHYRNQRSQLRSMSSAYSIAALPSQTPLHSSEDVSKSTESAPKFLGRMNTRSLSFSSTSSSWSSSSLSDPESETELDADQRRSALPRRNKILPPPTLSPILMPTISMPDASPIPIRPKSPSALSVGSLIDDNSSSCSCSDGEEDVFTNSWPKLDKASIQDLCYRTSLNDSHSQSLSELPPPPSLLSLQHQRDEMTPNRKYLTLSTSIWGPGWHQVEPLPPSFVKTLQQSELEAQAQAQALAQEKEKAAQAAMSPKAKAKKAKQQAKVAAAAAAAAATGADESSVSTPTTIDKDSFPMEKNPPGSIMNTLCSARLPRSLQFVD